MTIKQGRLPFGPLYNRNLLSNHWLENRLLLEPEWKEYSHAAARALHEVSQLWKQQSKRVEQYAEPSLEEAFIQPIFKALGWTLLYQTYLRGRKPDYALFLADSDLDRALAKGRKSPDFWVHAAVVADAKSWMINLDRPAIVNDRREYPPEQIEWYIHHSQKRYGILTNGRFWRLYPRDLSAHQPRFNTYLECDLATLLDRCTNAGHIKGQPTFLPEDDPILKDFLTFYLFFSPVALLTPQTRKPLIQRAIEGSNEYRLGVGEGLKDRVFEALRICTVGFLSHKPNNLNPHEHLSLCKEQSLVLLYRLLFIMYAEDRELLPFRSNRTYRENRSLARLRDDIAVRITSIERGTNQRFDCTAQGLWDDLTLLFDLIDHGAKRYAVPAYNGGLFDPYETPFLSEKVLPDTYLARVIDQLGRAPDAEHPNAGLFRVDYRDLSIRHLGHVYEGLLELRPQWAQEEMLVIRKKNHQRAQEKVIPAAQRVPKGFEYTGERYEPGEVFLLTDKGERRATGSYYTPDHIVDHIISQTLRPLCQEVSETLVAEIKETQTRFKRARGRSRELLAQKLEQLKNDFHARILRLTVLDPAMGSGHFLLRACQYLAEEIATNPHTGDPHAEQFLADESILTFWKRRVVEHCLYGVDINPLAVELAKVALWLETAAMAQPLTFLDHHLRCGNSLVGGRVADLGALPGVEPLPLFEQEASSRLPSLLEAFKLIADNPSDTRDDIKLKTKIYRLTVDPVRKPFLAVADLWSATFFLDKPSQITPDQYQQALHTVTTPGEHRKLLKTKWFQHALRTARHPDVACFHWELEYPDVFFDLAGRRPEAGFDIIIGNPPYDVLSEKETGHDLEPFKDFLRAQPIYQPSFRGKNNLYKLFVCLAVDLLRQGGRLAIITPMAILGDDQAADIRRMLLDAGAFTSIDAFPQKDDPRRRVFPEAKLSTAVFSYQKTDIPKAKAQQFTSHVHPAQYIDPAAPSLTLNNEQIPLYDPTNLTIVSCSQQDWDLATRITSSGQMGRLGDSAEFFQGEVNETNERAKGNLQVDPKNAALVTRGACICLYVPRSASQGDDLFLDVTSFLQGKAENTKAFHHRFRRIALQESSPQNNFRRIIAALIPKGQFCNHKINYLPEPTSKLPLEFVVALLDSKLSDWYFRLGSTNAAVSHYQLYSLPCPAFCEGESPRDTDLRREATSAVNAAALDTVLPILQPALQAPPFSLAVRDTIVALVNRIIEAERARGEISRAERSALSPQAQPYQDLIDRLFYAMAGLTADEAQGLEDRLSKML